ncbi:MAG: 16S rRNA (guanine(527)-N(7))-methyltransferase RsmG [Desulfotalea sp.]
MAFDFKRELQKGLTSLDIEIDNEAITRLEFYFTELKKWNKKVNLIAKKTSDSDIVENHFVDSLALLRFLPAGANLVDIGSGAGLPGLICKAARPDLQVDLVEPRSNRILFMRHIIRGLKLDDVEVYEARIEDTDLNKKESVSHVTSRAVSDIEGFVKMTASFSTGVNRLCLKGPKCQEELEQAEPTLVKHGLEKETIYEYKLPNSGAFRTIVVLK